MTLKNPSHPGEIIREEVLAPLGLTVTEAAKVLGGSSANPLQPAERECILFFFLKKKKKKIFFLKKKKKKKKMTLAKGPQAGEGPEGSSATAGGRIAPPHRVS